MTDAEINEYIDSYFGQLEKKIVSALRSQFYCGVFKTADDTNLHFPDEVIELTDIEPGQIVKLDDGRLASGDYTMPDGTVLKIGTDGKLKKIIPPTPDEIAAKIRADMAAFKKEIRALVVRKPFKESNCK